MQYRFQVQQEILNYRYTWSFKKKKCIIISRPKKKGCRMKKKNIEHSERWKKELKKKKWKK